MSSDLKGRQKGRFLHSFTFAISGIFHALEMNEI